MARSVRAATESHRFVAVIVSTARHVLNACGGVIIAVAIIYAGDRLVDPVWSEYSEVVRLDTDHVVLHLYGNKIRDLKLASPPSVQGFAIDDSGRRRIVAVQGVGTRPVSYPRGWADFGWWKFTDESPNPRPIVSAEIEIDYLCIIGVCTKTLGPFHVD